MNKYFIILSVLVQVIISATDLPSQERPEQDTTRTIATNSNATKQDAEKKMPSGEFNFSAPRELEERLYRMETAVEKMAPDGTRLSTDIYRALIAAAPLALKDPDASRESVLYVCREFTVQRGAMPPFPIPTLAGWSYIYSPSVEGIDDQGRVYGIDHMIFDTLEVGGIPLGPEMSYLIYNTFIDFTGFSHTFGRPTSEGVGIQDLHIAGDRIVHAAAHTEPPVHLGAAIAEGSYFRNGEATLEFLGVGTVDGAPSAVVQFDSGASSFKMISTPMPNMRIPTTGSSHYRGELYIDLATSWIRRVSMIEIVVSQTRLPKPPGGELNAVIERHLEIRDVTTTHE